MLIGAGSVTVPVPVGVTVTVYVCGVAVVLGVEEEPEPEPEPQASSKPASEIASAVSSTAIARFRRRPNGAPSSTAHTMIAPPLFHGRAGACFAALVVSENVSVVEPFPLLVSVTEGALAVSVVAELVGLKLTVPT
jgi:hypothetical protein